MRFELHCHSHYSRGKKIPWEAFMSPREIIKTARLKGIFGVAITDHDDSRAWKEAKRAAREYGLIFIPSMEINTRKGHLIGLGLNEHIDRDLGLQETIENIHEQGALAIAPHPFDLRSHGIKNGVYYVDAVEVFNSMNLDKLSNRLAFNKAEEFGRPMVVGSDSHSEEMFGLAVNEINAYDLDSALKEIKAGRVEFQTDYMPLSVLMDWAKERFTRSYMEVMKYINHNYSPPRAWVAKGMLRRYVLSKNRTWDGFWKLLGNFGLGCSMVYGGMRFLTYY
ncbi:MAG: PHP domain-containing protein [Candidatus Aenigmatarchaeota archaeon]|nr:MAG: PHP domain-containing protein [Candidatus Aenigmarchaeota archaeon]